jgi:hypothetical protein
MPLRKVNDNRIRCLLILAIVVITSCLSAQASVVSTGKGVWIWRIWEWEVENGDLTTIIGRLESAGVDWVTIKCGDSNSYWLSPGRQLKVWADGYGGFANVVNQFHVAGIRVFGWHFIYSIDLYGISGVSEPDVSKFILGISGMDGLILNPENTQYATWNYKSDTATQYMEAIRASYPTSFIAYSAYARVSSFPWYPWLEFGRYSNVNMPQAYWAARPLAPVEEIQAMKEDFDYWHGLWEQGGHGNSVKPIVPAGQGGQLEIGRDIYTGEIMTFCNTIYDYGYQGVSLYRYGLMDQSSWNEYSSCWEAALPDLIVEDIWIDPAEFGPGDTVDLCVRIKNIGDAAAGGFLLKRYLDGGYVAPSYGAEGLGAGYSTTLPTSWELTWPADWNSYTVKVIIDADGDVPESDEGNNERSEAFSAAEDTTDPSEVSNLHSTSHSLSSWSSDNTIDVAWTAATDDHMGPVFFYLTEQLKGYWRGNKYDKFSTNKWYMVLPYQNRRQCWKLG